jgi:hypothetical protein
MKNPKQKVVGNKKSNPTCRINKVEKIKPYLKLILPALNVIIAVIKFDTTATSLKKFAKVGGANPPFATKSFFIFTGTSSLIKILLL